jgi:hypothetical protein
VRPRQAPGTRGFIGSFSITDPALQHPAGATLNFPPTGLLPLESLSPPDFRRFLRPKNSRLFFFSKP